MEKTDFFCFFPEISPSNSSIDLKSFFPKEITRSPSAVSEIPFGVLSKRVTPNSFSNSLIARERLGCAIYSSSAALLSDPAFAAATAYFRYTIFTTDSPS